MRTYTRKMKTASNKNLDVFDFKDETDVPEFALRIKSKLENPRSAIDKYTYLATAAAGKTISEEDINYVPSLGIDVINNNHFAITLVEGSSAGMLADSNDASTVAKHCPVSGPEGTDRSESDASTPAGAEVTVGTPSASPSNSKLNSVFPNLPELDEAVELDSDENGSMCERSLSSSDVAEDDSGQSSDHCIGRWDVDNEDTPRVVFYPDHVVYQDSCYTDSVISFTSNFIEMEGSTADGDEKTFKCKWGIEDVLHIRSHWYDRVEMAMVKIHVHTKNTMQTENVECTSGTELKFAVIGSSWYGRVEAIASLNFAYMGLWKNMLESEETESGRGGVSFSKYLPNFDPPFEVVVYPKGDADPVSISKRDFELLQPDTFVNDTIIDFYIKVLKNKISPEERHRFHFFNSFFFRKLADPDKDPLDASAGRAGFQRVKRWTRKVSLFEKDFVFIPVNYNYHWSLLVLCHLGDVARYEDEDAYESRKVPCVLHMDSIRGSHAGLKGFVQSYLKEEWKERQQGACEDISSRFDKLKFISLELPQQQNSFDCGLFLLHYVELFLEQAPLHFNPFKITKEGNFLNVDWFLPAEASLKRVVIQRLICDLLENPNQKSSVTAGIDEQYNLSCPTNIDKGTIVSLSPVGCNRSMPHQESHANHGNEISLRPSSSRQCVDDLNIALKPSFESESLLETHFSAFNDTTTIAEYKGSLIPLEDDEVGQQFIYPHMESALQQDDGITSTQPNSSQDFRSREHWHADVISEHEAENKNIDISPETPISGCDNTIEIINECNQLNSEVRLEKTDKLKSPVQCTLVDDDGDDDHMSSMAKISGLSFNLSDMQGTDPTGLDSDGQHPTKKMRKGEP